VTIKSAYWDYPVWDGALWDTVVCEITGSWISDDDSWAGNVYVADCLWGAWTEKDDTVAGSIANYIALNANFQDGFDEWAGRVEITPPDESNVWENPDIWNGLIYVTLQPPVYNAGGTWWFHEWGERLPDWRARHKAMEDAYAAWRYKITGAWTSQSSSWGGRVLLAEVPEERLQKQIKWMFGETEAPYDDEEDLLWLI
jgi:hypothetical protein